MQVPPLPRADGNGLSRLEVGVGFQGKHPWTLPEFLGALEHTASLPVSIGRGDQKVTTPLFKADVQLARETLHATTKGTTKIPVGFKPTAWWLTPCEPLLLVEYDVDREAIPTPDEFRSADHAKTHGVDLAYGRMSLLKRTVGVWLFGKHRDTDRDYRHRLRIYLLRLHAQREVVKELLRAIQTERLGVVRTTPADPPQHPSNVLQQFVSTTIEQMEQDQYFGLHASELLRAAEEMQDSMTEGERTSILQRMRPLRKSLQSAVERFIEAKVPIEKLTVVEPGGHMNEQNVNISGTVHGDVQVNQLVAQTITNALNHVQQSNASDDMKARLAKVNELVEQLVKKVPPDVQEKVAKNLDMLTKEATSKKPDRAWYDVSANGLMEAAKSVAELAAPVTTAVKAVLALLA